MTESRNMQAATQLLKMGGIEAVKKQAALRMWFEQTLQQAFVHNVHETQLLEERLTKEVARLPTTHFLSSLAPLLVRCFISSIDLKCFHQHLEFQQFYDIVTNVAAKFDKMHQFSELVRRTCQFEIQYQQLVEPQLVAYWHKDLQLLLSRFVSEAFTNQSQLPATIMICQAVSSFGLQSIVNNSLTPLFESQLDQRITSQPVDKNTQFLLTPCLHFFEKELHQFALQTAPQWQLSYTNRVYVCFMNKVTSEILNLIVTGMQPSLLNEIVQAIKFKKYDSFVDEIVKQIKQRLLLITQTTEKILQVYLKIIEVMKIIDPTTALPQKITEPIKLYLKTERQRETLKCIVNMILDPKQLMYGQLQQQRYTAGTRPLALQTDGYISTDEDEAAAELWQPQPLSFGQLYISARRRKYDQISNLVDIYGSQDQFLKVYKLMLDKRLLTSLDDNFMRELKNLEHIKLRFGESSLYACDVMLRDIKESDRLGKQLKSDHLPMHQGLLTLDKLKVNIVSPGFWNQVKEEELKMLQMPQTLAVPFDEFQSFYKKAKPMRKLIFSESLGTVQLTLSWDDGSSQQFTVTPIQALVISTFNKTDSQEVTQSLTQLSTSLHLDKETLMQALQFWTSCGVLNSLPDETFESLSVRRLPTAQIAVFTQKPVVIEQEDSFEAEQQLHSLAKEHITRVMQECPGYSLKQVSLVIRNVPALKQISEDLVKDIYDSRI